MDRRAFISAITGSLLAAPLATEAQPAGRIYRVGVLSYFSPDVLQPNLATFREALRQQGYVEVVHRTPPPPPVVPSFAPRRRLVPTKLTLDEVTEIRATYVPGTRGYRSDFSQRALAARFGVSQPLVWRIVNGRRWKTS